MTPLHNFAAITAVITGAVAFIVYDSQPITISGYMDGIADGDTFSVAGHRIRLWGIDAPELKQSHGQDAKLTLERLVGTDKVTCVQKDIDNYKRIVAKCSSGRFDIGAMMVVSGYALDYTKYSGGAYSEEMEWAKKERLGMWRSDFMTPEEWRRRRNSDTKNR